MTGVQTCALPIWSGLIAEVSSKLFSMGVSITSVNARMGKNHTASMVFGFEITETAQLETILRALKSIGGVREAFRIHK